VFVCVYVCVCVGVLQGWCLGCHRQRSHFPGIIVIGIDGWLSERQGATRLGRAAGGLALGCYFQLQGTRAELTAKAFVHPARGGSEGGREGGRVCVARGGSRREERREEGARGCV